MKRTIILGAGLAAFGVLTAAPAGADVVVPPSLECDEIGQCNIVQYTLERYLELPGDTIENYKNLPGDTVEAYKNLIPDTIKNYTGIDIRGDSGEDDDDDDGGDEGGGDEGGGDTE